MKNRISIFLSIIIFVSCGQTLSDNFNNKTSTAFTIDREIKTFSYESLTIPLFFKTLAKNHLSDYRAIDSLGFSDLSKTNALKSTDSSNISNFYTIILLHDLFTSQTAANCSKGKILNIPYLWHWVTPNPRHNIYLAETGKLLKNIKPPLEFSKYNSSADIDRTPYLFLSDLFSVKPKYYSASCDTFSTFGWCSEREMAFVCLLELLNYQGKVMAEGNHSWSEFIIPMNTAQGKIKKFRVMVDNTFDRITWKEINNSELERWKNYNGDSPMANWYNQKAHSQNEKQRTKDFIISKKAMERIETRLVNYLEEQINNIQD